MPHAFPLSFQTSEAPQAVDVFAKNLGTMIFRTGPDFEFVGAFSNSRV